MVEVSGTHPALVLLEDLLGTLTWSYLKHLAYCAAREIGYGHELAGITYDDEPEEEDAPFQGVKLHATFRDPVAVMSRAELDAILADLFEVVIAGGEKATAPWWGELVEHARVVASRTRRPIP